LEKPIKIQILDHQYLIKSEEDEESVAKVAQYLNQKIKEVNDNSMGLSDKKKAILAALHIASDYFQLLKEQEEFVAHIRQRSKELIHTIDTVLE
jgi:cell division protein ZapA